MPPKEKYSRETILDAAFELVRTAGFGQLSVRNIARSLGCSTQPLYSSFESIGALEEALTFRLREFARSRILEYRDDESSFLAIGLGYFLFSRSEPMIFGRLFMNGGLNWSFTGDDPFFRPMLEKMKEDSWLVGVDDNQLGELFRDMFIYTHGLATQSHLSSKQISIETARELLKRMGGILITSVLSGGRYHGGNE